MRIIIELLKGNAETKKLLENIRKRDFFISIITSMELYYGAINKRELRKIKNFLDSFNLLLINEEISKIAINLIKSTQKARD
ncbi:PIN domain-containing protein [Persephonella sp.]